MRMDKLTSRFQQALADAQSLAVGRDHTMIEPVHVLTALLAGALLTLFGIIHSVDPRGGIYLPWDVEGLRATILWQFAGAYAAMAVLLGALSLQKKP